MWEAKKALDDYLYSIRHETQGERNERIEELIAHLKRQIANY